MKKGEREIHVWYGVGREKKSEREIQDRIRTERKLEERDRGRVSKHDDEIEARVTRPKGT